MTTETTPSITRNEPAEPDTPSGAFVPQPRNIEETGLELSLLVDLALKSIHFSGRPTGRQLSEHLALAFPVIEELVAFLRQEQALEVVGTAGIGEQAYQYALTKRGTEKAEEALGRNQYVGPAPVPLSLYTDVLQHQSVRDVHIDRKTFLDGVSHLVLSRNVLAALGPAANTGRSVLIYGNSGNGKSSLALAIAGMLPGAVLIPYAVEVHGQIIKVFDPRMHEPAEPQLAEERRQATAPPPAGQERRQDQRWVVAKRPTIRVGGELTLQDLELRYSELSKFYIAPLQWKANSGVLIIDDFGRQLVQPRELLNRWIVPMEQGVDRLSLHTGDTLDLPFEVLLIFSTNIPPAKLGDEAFFRRIRHKVEVPNPTREEYLAILTRVCEEQGVAHTEEGARYLVEAYYDQTDREFKGCHPRDLVELLIDITNFYGEEPELTPEWVDLACSSYFVEAEAA